MKNNVVRLPAIRHDIFNVCEKIKQFVYQEADGLSIVEVIGILEMVKIEISNDAKGE